MARWYVLDGGREPILTIEAPDRETAEHRTKWIGNGVSVVSVAEHQLIQEEFRAIARRSDTLAEWAREALRGHLRGEGK